MYSSSSTTNSISGNSNDLEYWTIKNEGRTRSIGFGSYAGLKISGDGNLLSWPVSFSFVPFSNSNPAPIPLPIIGLTGTAIFDTNVVAVTSPYFLGNVLNYEVAYDKYCIVLKTGEIYCAGSNSYGFGSNIISADNLVQITVNTKATSVSLSPNGFVGCALLYNGDVSCWGRNNNGSLGTGYLDPIIQSATPSLVIGVHNAVKIITSEVGTCAVINTGDITCWGPQFIGSNYLPTKISGISGALDIDHNGGKFFATVKINSTDSAIYAFDGLNRNPPTLMLSLKNNLKPNIAFTATHYCSIEQGEVYCFSSEDLKPFGFSGPILPNRNGNYYAITQAVGPGSVMLFHLDGIKNAVSIAGCGIKRSCVKLATGNIYCWGNLYQ